MAQNGVFGAIPGTPKIAVFSLNRHQTGYCTYPILGVGTRISVLRAEQALSRPRRASARIWPILGVYLGYIQGPGPRARIWGI